jgi:hypothetical protein
MSWTGFATDLTLTDVVGPPQDSSPGFKADQVLRAPPFRRPPPDVYTTEDMLPQRGPLRRWTVNIVGVLLLLLFAWAMLVKHVPALQPHKAKPSVAHPAAYSHTPVRLLPARDAH